MKNIALIVLFAAITGIAVWIAMGGLSPQLDVAKDKLGDNSTMLTEQDCRDKLTQLKMKRDNVKRAITRLERQQADNLRFLKDAGIEKVADAAGNIEATTTLNNVKLINDLIEKRNEEISLIDDTIVRLEGMIKKFRQDNLNQSVALTEEQMIELMTIQNELDDRLNIDENDIFADEEIDALLQAERQKNSDDSDN